MDRPLYLLSVEELIDWAEDLERKKGDHNKKVIEISEEIIEIKHQLHLKLALTGECPTGKCKKCGLDCYYMHLHSPDNATSNYGPNCHTYSACEIIYRTINDFNDCTILDWKGKYQRVLDQASLECCYLGTDEVKKVLDNLILYGKVKINDVQVLEVVV